MSTYHRLNLILALVVSMLMIATLWYGIGWTWFVLIGLLYSGVCACGAFLLSWEFFMPVSSKGSSGRAQIALTFDDGPLPGSTERVLAILEAQDVKATFFCIGSRIQAAEDLLSRIHEAGHILGNHTFHHKKAFAFLSTRAVARELSETDKLIARATGSPPRLFRPPFGVTSPSIATTVRARQYITVGWSIRSFDSITASPERLFKRVTANVKAGDIVLFHDYSEAMISILPRFIQFLRKEGLEPVRLDKLLNEAAYR